MINAIINEEMELNTRTKKKKRKRRLKHINIDVTYVFCMTPNIDVTIGKLFEVFLIWTIECYLQKRSVNVIKRI